VIDPPAQFPHVVIPRGWSIVVDKHLVGSTDRVVLERIAQLIDRHGMSDEVGELPPDPFTAIEDAYAFTPRPSFLERWIARWFG
jgi:hypothetical protein